MVMVIRGVQYIANFILVRNFKFDVLIGSDFIYEHKGKIDFESNTMIIKNRIIVLRNKRELPGCNLLETLGRQQIEPYSISHLKVQPRNRSYNKSTGCCIIIPLNTSILFENQPGLMSHSISVNKDRGPYILPIINNTGHTFKVKDKLIVAFIEQFSSMDKARHMSTLQRQHSAFLTVKHNTKQARDNIKIQADKKAKQRRFQVGDPVFLHDPTIDVGQIKKFSSPWKPYYRIIDMITPVTAHIRCQKSGESRTAHVNNLRYANINQAWDFDNSNEDSNEEQSFPEQNIRRWVAPTKRKQPNRRVKMLVPDYAETDTDSTNEDREDNIPQSDDNSTSYNNVPNDNINHDNRQSTSAESDVDHHNRTTGERANSPVERVMSEPTDMIPDDVHDNGCAAKRRDSDSTIIYDPVDFECGIKRTRHDSTDSPVELDDDSRQASKYARVDDSSEDDENSSSSIFNG